ncbi:MAG TPA: oxygenase MpaB family protein [Terracidiphilus sp.]|nr:oxygenase MpaB family protein [Terracidiphilus sp.]
MGTGSTETGELVTRSDLERLLAAVESRNGDTCAGIFGPQSISWRINCESALFLGAGRAALLQLAHPWVAAALRQHSSLLADPIARFHNTFRIVFTMVFGTTQQAFSAARGLHQLHTRIGGDLPSAVAGYARGSRYEANHIPALRWVYATLVESAVLAYEGVMPALTHPERETYYAESKVLAGLFGIPAAALPADWTTFKGYVAEVCTSDELGVDEQARSMAQGLLAGAGSWVHPPRWYRALTTAWLPPRLREEFGLPFGPAEERAVIKAQRRLPRLYRQVPGFLRFVGPYHEARARLAGRAPGPLGRASTRFWTGASRMPFGE